MTGIKIAAVVMMLSAAGTVAELIPVVPESWQSWPATAILGFITLMALSCLVVMARSVGKAMLQTASHLGGMKQQEEERNRRFDEFLSKLGSTNLEMGKLNANLKARPCLIDDKAHKDRMKRTQEVEP